MLFLNLSPVRYLRMRRITGHDGLLIGLVDRVETRKWQFQLLAITLVRSSSTSGLLLRPGTYTRCRIYLPPPPNLAGRSLPYVFTIATFATRAETSITSARSRRTSGHGGPPHLRSGFDRDIARGWSSVSRTSRWRKDSNLAGCSLPYVFTIAPFATRQVSLRLLQASVASARSRRTSGQGGLPHLPSGFGRDIARG